MGKSSRPRAAKNLSLKPSSAKPGLMLRSLLAGGDRRSIGKSESVVDLLESRPKLLRALLDLLWDANTLVAMRAADALEKYTRDKRTVPQAYKKQLIGLMHECTQQEVRWHLAAIVPNLWLTQAECRHVAQILGTYLHDRSSIVKTYAMHGLSDLTRQDQALHGEVLELIRALTRSGTPAMRARGRHLLKVLESKRT